MKRDNIINIILLCVIGYSIVSLTILQFFREYGFYIYLFVLFDAIIVFGAVHLYFSNFRTIKKIKEERDKFYEYAILNNSIIQEYDIPSNTLRCSHSVIDIFDGSEIVTNFTEWLQTKCDIYKEDLPKVIQIYKNPGKPGVTYSFENRSFNIRTGRYEWFKTEYRTLANAKGEVIKMYCRITNIQKDKELIASLEAKASRDSLTGLLNKVSYESLAQVKFDENKYLLIIDIDQFKTVNDTQGHLYGDEVIVELTNLIKETFNQPDDLCGRVGGDEFSVLTTSKEKTKAKIKDIFQKIDKLDHKFTISVGGTSVAGKTYNDAFSDADINLYVAKKVFGNTIRI